MLLRCISIVRLSKPLALIRKTVIFLFLLLAPAMCFRLYAQIQQTNEQLGVQYYQSREYDKALLIFEDLFERSPNLFNYTYYINILFETQQFEKAEKILKKLIRQNSTELRYQVDMGYLYLQRGETQKGKSQYEEALKNLKADRNQVYNLAGAYLTRRETEFAVKTYLKGRELLKDPVQFAYELASMYESIGNYSSMLEEYFTQLKKEGSQQGIVQSRLQNWLNDDPDDVKKDLLRNMLLQKTQKEPNEIIYAELLLWYSVQQKDFSLALMQAKALDRRYLEYGKRVFDLAQLAASNEDYEVAADGYAYVINKNADPLLVLMSKTELLSAEMELATRGAIDKPRLLILEKRFHALLAETGKTPSTVPVMRSLAHLQAFYLNQPDSATALLEEAIRMPGIFPTVQAQCKLELADIYLFTGEQWEVTLLYSQVEKAFKNEPMGHEAKFRNAKLFYYIGEFGWAKAQLDILKAATSKLIANDALELSLIISDNIDEDSITKPLEMYARADLDVYRNQFSDALATLDSVEKLFPGHPIQDDILYKKAEISIRLGSYEKAAGYYSEIIKDYATGLLADDAIFDLAMLNEEHLGNKPRAMELYQMLLTNQPGSLYVVEARKRFRALRNDPVN